MCAPTSLPFSTTQTAASGASCFSRMAAARPEGPPPTTTTSNSIASRGGNSSAIACLLYRRRNPRQSGAMAQNRQAGKGTR